MRRPSQYVGRRVRKRFGDFGVFVGTVVSYRTYGKLLYLIRYEDDDEEELDRVELEKHLIPGPLCANGSLDMDSTR
jgi:hypothetical protein